MSVMDAEGLSSTNSKPSGLLHFPKHNRRKLTSDPLDERSPDSEPSTRQYPIYYSEHEYAGYDMARDAPQDECGDGCAGEHEEGDDPGGDVVGEGAEAEFGDDGCSWRETGSKDRR